VSKRLSPAERLRTQIDEVFAGGQDLSRAIEQVAQLGAQLLLQCALEAQVTMMLGRERYERAASCQDACAGMRNGYCATTIKTTAGPVTLQRPKVRGTTERVADRLFGKGVTKTNALESLVIAGFVRGLSVRDVEAALAEALGPQATVSKSTVSRICAQIKTQFEAFSQRRLDDVELDYLFLDGSHFKYHVGAAAEPVLAAWGIDTDGNLRCLCRSLPEWLCGAVHRTAIVFSSCRIAGTPLRNVGTAVDVTDGAELGVCVRGDVVDLVAGADDGECRVRWGWGGQGGCGQ